MGWMWHDLGHSYLWSEVTLGTVLVIILLFAQKFIPSVFELVSTTFCSCSLERLVASDFFLFSFYSSWLSSLSLPSLLCPSSWVVCPHHPLTLCCTLGIHVKMTVSAEMWGIIGQATPRTSMYGGCEGLGVYALVPDWNDNICQIHVSVQELWDYR